jgi:hypothetical protein
MTEELVARVWAALNGLVKWTVIATQIATTATLHAIEALERRGRSGRDRMT